MDGAPAYGHIVVGVDGSPTSRAALRWAAREAELRRCALDVVYGWQVKGEPRPPGEWGGVAPPVEAYQEQAEARTRAIVDEVLPDGAKCELAVHAMHKPAGRALLSFCDTADLLVVGAKERGRLAGWLVGSTSDEALKNAACTVVVVRPQVPTGATRSPSSTDEPARSADPPASSTQPPQASVSSADPPPTSADTPASSADASSPDRSGTREEGSG
jgi:nucleotide-binding universal stress UspA family protein